jgi:hypothetical protein
LQLAVLLLEMTERVLVDERNQHEAVAVRRPKRPIDGVDGFGCPPLIKLAGAAREELKVWIKNAL